MAGKPQRTPKDGKRFYDEYMAYLKADQANIDMTYQANQIMKKTGQTPAPMADNRTTVEKIQDILRLKIELMGELQQITDTTHAQDIINHLSNDEIVFLAQYAPKLVAELQPKYKYGILSSIFLPIFRNYMKQELYPIKLAQDQQKHKDDTQYKLAALGKQALEHQSNQDLAKSDLKSMVYDVKKNQFLANNQNKLNEISAPYNSKQRAFLRAEKAAAEEESLYDLPAEEPVKAVAIKPVKANPIPDFIDLEKILKQTADHKKIYAREMFDYLVPMIGKKRKTEDDNTLGSYILKKGIMTPEELNEYPNLSFGNIKVRYLDEFIKELNLDFLQKHSSGKGLKRRMKGRGIIRAAANYTKGIQDKSSYVPFGRFFIDNQRLDDNIVALKRGSGLNIGGFPVVRVSNNFGDVMRTIIGGGNPKFDSLEKLSQDEKQYLHKVAKHSKIIDRLSIPAPNKSEMDKDVHQFEVMKGEILAGNDSIELVKKFKVLIVKLINNDLLPKGQGKTILLELATLGF